MWKMQKMQKNPKNVRKKMYTFGTYKLTLAVDRKTTIFKGGLERGQRVLCGVWSDRSVSV